MDKPSFFSAREARQPVNFWIAVAFFAICMVWLVLYYATEKAKIMGDYYSGDIAAFNRSQ